MNNITSYQLLNSIFNCENICAYEKLFMAFLINAYFSFNSQAFYMFDAHISATLNISRRTIIRIRQSLQSMGFISTSSKVVNNSKALVYNLNLQAILNPQSKAVFSPFNEVKEEKNTITQSEVESALFDDEIENTVFQVAFDAESPIEAQKEPNKEELVENNISTSTEVESALNRPKRALKDEFYKTFSIEELKLWQSQLKEDNTTDIQRDASERINKLISNYSADIESMWLSFITFLMDTDFNIPNVADVPEWCWNELVSTFTKKEETTVEDIFGDVEKEYVTVLRPNKEINAIYNQMLNRYNIEQQVELKKYSRTVYNDLLFSYGN